MPVSLDALQKELEAKVKECKAFSDHSFSVFDTKDFAAKTEGQGLNFPLVAVGWDGAEPAVSDDGQRGNRVNSVSSGSNSSVMMAVQFAVVVAVQYSYGGQDDTKPSATELLDELRSILLGYKGVNSRPWRWVGEQPDKSASGNGVLFYVQAWQTNVPSLGTFQQ